MKLLEEHERCYSDEAGESLEKVATQLRIEAGLSRAISGENAEKYPILAPDA